MAMPEATITRSVLEKKKLAEASFSEVERRLQRLYVGRGRALLPLRHVERDLLALFQRFVARPLDRAVMGEQVLAAVIRRNEPETLRVVEPLYGTCSNVFSFLTLREANRASLAGTMIRKGIDFD